MKFELLTNTSQRMLDDIRKTPSDKRLKKVSSQREEKHSDDVRFFSSNRISNRLVHVNVFTTIMRISRI